MADRPKRGQVRIEPPPVKLVAARREDEGMEEENKRMQANYKGPDSCGGL